MTIKAIALLSGGLDSTLAAMVIAREGIEVVGCHMVHLFASKTPDSKTELSAVKAARRIGIPIRLVHNSPEMLEMVKSPEFGYGSNFNPCIDCRILTLTMARKLMVKEGAQFLISGEVIGQRPMSQRRDPMIKVTKRANVEGLLLRPLCAKRLDETIPEQKGWVDREKLYDISGRSRKPQFELARQFGLTEYPSPAGGCLLTDPGFAIRMKDLVKRDCFTLSDVHMAKIGRHLALDENIRLVIGRKESENDKVFTFAHPGDTILETASVPGPTAALTGNHDKKALLMAASIVARYSKARSHPETDIRYFTKGGGPEGILTVKPASIEESDKLLLEN